MFGTTNYPFNFANRNGIPMIESTAVNINDTNVVITIHNRAFWYIDDKGIILFKMSQAMPKGGDALPVLFSSNDFTQPITLVGGNEATGTNLDGTGVYLIYYDKDANIMQLLTTAA